MHIKQSKKIAVLGIMAALSTVLTVLGTVISVNTVFFTAAAAFLTGIAVIYCGMGYAAAYYAVCLLLDVLVNPDKMNVILFAALAGYILLAEGSYCGMHKMPDGKKKEWLHRGIRLLLFEVMYLPLILFLPQLFVSETILAAAWFLPLMIPAGIVCWFIYDAAYFGAKRWIGVKLQNIV